MHNERETKHILPSHRGVNAPDLNPPQWLAGFPTAPVGGVISTGSALLGRMPLPVARNLARWALQQVFEPRDVGRHIVPGSEDDPYFLGPDTISAQIIGDASAIHGGIRSLCMQAWHPLVMAGVAQHSGFAEAPMKRLQNTSLWVGETTFGTWPSVRKLARRVRGYHQHVAGEYDGVAYEAAELRHLAWVQLTLIESILVAYRTWGPKTLSQGDADQFVREQARVAALLSRDFVLEAGTPLPTAAELDATAMIAGGYMGHDEASMREVMRSYADELVLIPEAYDTLEFLRAPLELPRVLRAGYRLFFAGLAATLPDELAAAARGPRNAIAGSTAVTAAGLVAAAIRASSGTNSSAERAAERLRGN